MSFSIRNTIALSALSALAAAQTTPPKLDATCADVVIFMARGNDAPYRDGRTFPFVEATCGKLTAEGKTCDYIDIQFDVTLGGDYCAQVAEGARNGMAQITAFNQKCPCSHIVVNGYSEGAHVVGDVLGGPGGCSPVSTGIDNTSSAGKASKYLPIISHLSSADLDKLLRLCCGAMSCTPQTSLTTSSMAQASRRTHALPAISPV
jgi:hypothetical protein